MPTRALMARLIRENVKPYRGWLGLAVLFMALVAAATAASSYILEFVVNDIFIARDQGQLWPIALTILFIFLVKGGANYAQTVIMSLVGLRIIADCQNRLFGHLTRMDVHFFQANPAGTLVSRFINDITAIRNAVSTALTSLGRDVLSLIGLTSVLFVQDTELAIIVCFVFPLAIYPIARLGKRVRKVVANTQHETGLMTALLNQTFQGIRIVKAYRMQDYEARRIRGIVDSIYRLTLKASRTQALASPVMETLGGIAVAIVVVYGGARVMAGQTDAGSFFSFIAALLLAYEPAKRLANLNATIQVGLAGAERMFKILDTSPRILEPSDAIELSVKNGEILLEDVHFRYETDCAVLEGLSLHVPAGKTVALVGASGAGKSTVFNLIPRFYDIDGGRIEIDGNDVSRCTFASLHGSIALVSQEITLFDDTVMANISYGRIGATAEDIERAAKRAAAHGFIMALPEGYNTVVGEQGLKLSGGQRQRLAIARAMLKDAPILLLDEATSALDTESERKVQEALDELIEGRTALVIAHRLSTVVGADIIYVIDQGRAIECGTHEELLEQRGQYHRLYELQFRDNRVSDEAG